MIQRSHATSIQNWIVVFVFVFLAVIAQLFPGHPFDMECWKTWSLKIFNTGLNSIYDGSGADDYPPLYNYLLFIYGKLMSSQEAILSNANLIRLAPLMADFIALYFLYKWIDKKTSYLIIILTCMLNIGFSYNTIIWGQVDAILSAFVFVSFYFAYEKKMIKSSILFVLAVNMKLQALVFLPVWLILYLFNYSSKRNIGQLIYPILTAIIVQVLLLIPFLPDSGISNLWDVVKNSFSKYPIISFNAYNFWHLVKPNAANSNDSDVYFMSMSYKTFGQLLFLICSFVALLPLILPLLRNLFQKKNIWPDRRAVWLVCAIVSILFFFFNTEMHERYSHPALIFTAAYSFYTRNWIPFILFSFTYLLQLDSVLKGLHLFYYKIILFDHIFIAVLFLILIVILVKILVQKNYFSSLIQK